MTTKTHEKKSTDVVITRTFNAPLERVWEAWTHPEELKKWWGPKDFTAPAITTDFREGGTFHYCMHGPAGSEFDKDLWSGGVFKEIIPMKKIVATDYFADDKGNKISPKEYGMPGDDWPDEMLVTVTFEEVAPGKTKLTLLHQGHGKEMVEPATQGWNESLDKFAAIL
jgi:uncharacterized protein YndB with AHSA1/START domain